MLHTKFIPAKQKESKCLMVVLHGLGDSIAGFEWLPAALNLDWMNYLLVNAPDKHYGGYSWYDYPGDHGPGIQRSRKLLFELLDAQRAEGFPTGQTILGGFSQGCLMTVEVALRYPHVFAGLVGISGYVFEPENLLKELSPVAMRQRFLITHGYQDKVIPFEKAKVQFDLLQGAGIQIEWKEFHKAHTIAGETELKVIREFIEKGYPVAARAGK